jgi:aspartate aminotransferase-like enzyme
MLAYAIPLVPGPTRVPESVRRAYLTDYASGDLEPEYSQLYAGVQEQLRTILATRNQLAIMTGEGMIALWGALKSCIRPGERVLAVSTGVFGYGIGEMAAAIGAEVRWVEFGYDEILQPGPLEQAIEEFRPKLVTRHRVPLFYLDAVASAGGTPLLTDEWGIDLCLIGNQKALSALPDLAAVAVSQRAWEIIADVNYPGYDALAPYREALEKRWFPYTPAWASLAALHEACRLILEEGMDRVFARHERVAQRCRDRARELGLSLYPAEEAGCSPTVTALEVPESIGWGALDRRLREHGMGVGGSLGPLAGKVFRIGHMGAQADMALVDRGMDVLAHVLAETQS